MKTLEQKTIETIQKYSGTSEIRTFMNKHNISYNRTQNNIKITFNCYHPSFIGGKIRVIIK